LYEKGERVVYGSAGACQVEDVVPRCLDGRGKERLCYILRPLYSDYSITVPVDSDKVFMRPVMSRGEAERLIDTIPGIRATAYHNRVLRQLTEHYEEYLKTHDCADLLELTMSIYAKKQAAEQQKRKFGAVDERFMKRAEDLLFGELAAALDIPRDEVSSYIEHRLQAAGKDRSAT